MRTYQRTHERVKLSLSSPIRFRVELTQLITFHHQLLIVLHRWFTCADGDLGGGDAEGHHGERVAPEYHAHRARLPGPCGVVLL
jgi:hypothetical protein